MGISLANIDIGSALSGIGGLAKSIRTAITGKEPIDAGKAAELAMEVQQLENEIEMARMNVVIAEASSKDPWTSRARPAFMYVIYIMLLWAIPMSIVAAVNPDVAMNIGKGFGAWLAAIPGDLYALFGAGYLGYGAFRTYDKKVESSK
jgi:Holin of 3TMs, for gene-transfer release